MSCPNHPIPAAIDDAVASFLGCEEREFYWPAPGAQPSSVAGAVRQTFQQPVRAMPAQQQQCRACAALDPEIDIPCFEPRHAGGKFAVMPAGASFRGTCWLRASGIFPAE